MKPARLLLTAAILPSLVLSLCIADDMQEAKFLLAWGQKGDKPGEFYSPVGIAINKKDEIFVTDVNNARVQKFSVEGTFLGSFDLPRDEPKRISNQAGGIAIDENGLLYLSFMSQHKVAVYAGDGKLVREWGKKGKDDGEFNQPGGIVFGPEGTVYVTDQCNHRVQQFTTTGKFLAQWGEYGKQPGQFGDPGSPGSRFGGPHLIARDSQGRLYTTEGTVGRVQQFSSAGKPLAAWGNKGCMRAASATCKPAIPSTASVRSASSWIGSTASGSAASTTASRHSLPRAGSSSGSAAAARNLASSRGRTAWPSTAKATYTSAMPATSASRSLPSFANREPALAGSLVLRSSRGRCRCDAVVVRAYCLARCPKTGS